jgi:MFS family permease
VPCTACSAPRWCYPCRPSARFGGAARIYIAYDPERGVHARTEDPGLGAATTERATYRAAFAVAEFRALWLAQVTSVTGDQLARVALTVLVYDRTRSALLAAITFAVSIVPMFLGGIFLAGIGDRLPRRAVMVSCDVTRTVLVMLMVLPHMPVAALVVLLFVVTFLEAPFRSARAAIYPDVLPGELFTLGQTVSMTTYQAAQVCGFAAGGVIVGAVGTRTALIVDAATFAVSAILVRTGVREHAPSDGANQKRDRPRPVADARAGASLVFRTPALRTPMLLGWIAAFYNVPEGIAAPIAHATHGGTRAVGVILAAGALGGTVGNVAFSRLVPPARRAVLMAPCAACCCATLALFAFRPDLVVTVLILTGSGLLGGYQSAASATFVAATPSGHRAQAFGLAQGGMNLGQGIAMVVAGAIATYFSPLAVIAVTGVAGTATAIAIAMGNPDRVRLPACLAHFAPPSGLLASIVSRPRRAQPPPDTTSRENIGKIQITPVTISNIA